MDRGDYAMLLSVVVSWALYFGGLDDVPGWQGFGSGLFVGSLPALAMLILQRFGWFKKRASN